ncbi:MAG TPA: exodeoxyribonuclease VII large subunit [Pyrinomonadaceae bacterium]|nr:exodeoxyribonuclease VII large subunit [Pyrinomonadaceae bacterium]
MANQPLFNALFDETERKPLTVSQLTNSIRITLESRFAAVWVEGEISNFKAHSSGHWYFTLKDSNAQLRAKCFRSTNTRIRFRPTDGLHVRARGKLSLYAPRGEYELVVETLDPVGAGALQVAFEQLRDRLRAEGLFAKELKRPLPVFPRRVGIVTSPTGAAIRDILNVISRRTRTVHVLFSPARVQGDLAGPQIAHAIRLINLYHERALREGRTGDLVDVLIVGRGGGSTEDLWAFNTEEVARAIRKSAIPVISAVGHETDFTIADFVADFRAPTPSAAAEIVAAHEDQLCSALENMGRQLVRLTRYKIVDLRSRVQEQALSHAFDEVKSRLTRARRRFENASSACDAAMEIKLQDGRERLALAAASLDALSPLAVLQRGYAIAQDASGKLVRDAGTVNVGDEVNVRLARGKLNTRVVSTDQNQ